MPVLIEPETLLGWRPRVQTNMRVWVSHVASALRRTSLDPQQIAQWSRFTAERYCRQVLFRTPSWEMILACWLPGQFSTIHDHGGSAGAALVVAGQLEEVVFRRRNAGEVTAGASRKCPSGTVMVEYPETIHRVGNRGGDPAVSLHLYLPPLEDMHEYPCTAEGMPL